MLTTLRGRGALVAIALALATAPAAPALATHDETPEPDVPIYPMVFPVAGAHSYSDTWHAPRGGGSRVHLGTDIMADKMVPVVAVAAGTIGWMHDEQGGDCCALSLLHDDGWESWYIHLNNDTPGTDDGLGWGFADGISRGAHVEAGQLIGWVGDSGNAEGTSPHVHFQLGHPQLGWINPYPHLAAATEIPTPYDGSQAPPCPEDAACDSVVLVDDEARFHVFSDVDWGADRYTFAFGNPGDVSLMGDWDCDGMETPAMYRSSNGFMYLRNSNITGIADVEYYYGDPADVPLVGDWNGDGCDTLAIYRSEEGRVYLKNSLGTGVADLAYHFGNPGDRPFSGDFDGDGIDTIGLYRVETGFVYFRNSHTAGPADLEFFYGDPGDEIVAADWDGDGDDTVAVYRPSAGTLYVSLENAPGVADYEMLVGGGLDVHRIRAGVTAAVLPGIAHVAHGKHFSSWAPDPAIAACIAERINDRRQGAGSAPLEIVSDTGSLTAVLERAMDGREPSTADVADAVEALLGPGSKFDAHVLGYRDEYLLSDAEFRCRKHEPTAPDVPQGWGWESPLTTDHTSLVVVAWTGVRADLDDFVAPGYIYVLATPASEAEPGGE